MRRLIAMLLVVPFLFVWPVEAAQNGKWITTAPETGPSPVEYRWQLNLNGGGWATMGDDPVADDLEYPHLQLSGTAIQCRVCGMFEEVEPVLDSDTGELLGVNTVLVPGPWSILSDVNTVNEPGGACGRPQWWPF